MNPEISVIIPTFNRAPLLRRSLKSVLTQQDTAFEIIVADDGSTDGTQELIAREFPSVTYLHQKNKGVSAARNFAILHARGKWIALLDSDDEWKPGKLRAQMDFFQTHPDYRICQTEEIWIRNGVRVNPMKKHQKHGGFIFEKCLPLCLISPSAVMIHRELFDEAGFFDEALPACEDYDLWLRITCRFPVGLISTPYVLKYGGHEDQLSRQLPAMDRFRIYALEKIIASGHLTPGQTRAAEEMLRTKINIFNQGAAKRAGQTA